MAKVVIHPVPVKTLGELCDHTAIGPLPGQTVILIGMLFHLGWILLATLTLKGQHAAGRVERPADYEDPMLKMGNQ